MQAQHFAISCFPLLHRAQVQESKAFLDCRAFALSAKAASKCFVQAQHFAMAFASHYYAVRKSKKAFAFLDCRAFALSAKAASKCFVQAQHFAMAFASHYYAVRKSKKAFAFLDCRAFALSD